MRLKGRIRFYIPAASFLVFFALSPTLVLAPSPAHAQCLQLCGDYNCSGTVTVADILDITRWLYQLVPPCPTVECRDVDGDGVVTDRDVVWVTRAVLDGGALHCDSVAPPFSLKPANDFFLLHETTFPAGDSIVPIHIEIVNYLPLAGFSVTYLIKVGDSVAFMRGTGTSYIAEVFVGKGYLDVNYVTEGYGPALFGFSTLETSLPPGRRPALAEFEVHMPAASYDRAMTVELFDMDSAFPQPGAYRNSMAVDVDYNTYELTVGPPSCPYRLTGDVNMSSDLTSSDIIGLVNYVFKGGAAPLPCAASGDANCDFAVNSSDVIQMVNFVFKSGPPPCDLCAIYSDPWGCP